MLSSDIWRVVKDDSGHWGDPERLENPINSEGREYSPITDGKGNLYFASDRSGGYGQGDIYLSPLENGKFNTPINMGPVINSEKGEWNLEINHDGNLMIFEASQRPDNVSPYGDLYISFKEKGLWSVPQNISELNTSGSELYPFLTYDEKTLFFTSSDSLKSVDTNIYHTQFRSLYKTYKERAIFNE
jgi:hypothetical protein